MAETPIKNLAYASFAVSRIAKGRVATIETKEAEKSAGVLAVLTHLTFPKPGAAKVYPEGGTLQFFLPMQSDVINYAGQPIAIIVAETLEQARHAASLVEATCSEEQPAAAFEAELDKSFLPKKPFDKSAAIRRPLLILQNSKLKLFTLPR